MAETKLGLALEAAMAERYEKRIAELEAERDDLRQRLIGGVAGVKAFRDLTSWAEANDALLKQPKSR